MISISGKSLSELLAETKNYHKSEENNFTVKDKAKKMKEIEAHYKKEAKNINHFDGILLQFDDWWFNVRASNTENLLRLNIEAHSEGMLAQKIKEVSTLIQSS